MLVSSSLECHSWSQTRLQSRGAAPAPSSNTAQEPTSQARLASLPNGSIRAAKPGGAGRVFSDPTRPSGDAFERGRKLPTAQITWVGDPPPLAFPAAPINSSLSGRETVHVSPPSPLLLCSLALRPFSGSAPSLPEGYRNCVSIIHET